MIWQRESTSRSGAHASSKLTLRPFALPSVMVKSMDMSDSQRQKLVEATEIASAIATCEKDDNTKRMIVMSGLARVMEGFPVSLSSFFPPLPLLRLIKHPWS